MARKTIVQLVDDVDGSTIKDGQGETVEFGIGGDLYKIDLSNKHANELHEQLEFWIQHAEKISGSKKRKSRGPAATKTSGAAAANVEPGAVRTWAADQGIEVSSRGRVPQTIIDQYLAAH